MHRTETTHGEARWSAPAPRLMAVLMVALLATLLVAFWAGVSARAAEPPSLRVAVLETGTVNWELDTIQAEGLDEANGFTLDVRGMAGNPATRVAFQAGEADVVVADWIWVARQRAEGRDYVFIPYSKAVGSLLVPADSEARTLADLAGTTIGIAGGPVDKSWLILRAYASQELGFDLAAETDQAFGAPPLIFQNALAGEFGGAINFWHFAAKMEARGMRPLITVSEAAEALGLDPEVPLLGYVVPGELAREKPELVAGLAAASRGAKEILATDEAAWDRIRPRMRAERDEDFEALKAGFREGIPAPGPVDAEAAGRVLALMAELGGRDLVGSATTLPEGVFVSPTN